MSANKNAFANVLPAAAGLTFALSNYAPEPLISQAIASPKTSFEVSNLSNDTQINNVTGSTSWSTFQQLQGVYELRSPMTVISFLNDQIAALILDAGSVIHEYFDVAKLTLELRDDPENSSQTLLLSIHTKSSQKRAEDNLDSFDRNWWLWQRWFPSDKQICIDVFPS